MPRAAISVQNLSKRYLVGHRHKPVEQHSVRDLREVLARGLRNAARKAAGTDAFAKAMANVGQDVAYMDQPEFKAFWDAEQLHRDLASC